MSEETKENVIEGLIADQILYGKKYEPGVKFSYSTCLPPFANRFNGKLALYLMLEHTPEIMCPFLSAFMDEVLGEMIKKAIKKELEKGE